MLKRIKKNWEILVLVLISFVLIPIWFRRGLILGGGEIGLPFYNLKRTLEYVSSTWQHSFCTGGANIGALSSAPFYFFFFILERLAIPNFFLQALFFWLILLTCGLSIFFLGNLLIQSKEKRLISFIAALFYLLNPYVLANVWGRFLFPHITAVAYIPLFLYLFAEALITLNPKYILAFCLSSVLLSYTFETLAFILSVWISPFLFFLYYLWLNRKNFLKIIFFAGLIFIFWVLANLWWILPFLKLSSAFLEVNIGQLHTKQYHIDSLKGISRYFALPYSTRLLNYWYFFEGKICGKIYSTSFFQFISWLPPIVIFIGLILSKLKDKGLRFFFVLTCLVLFLAKGSSAPFGEIIIWLADKLPFLAAFRNPFEKWGILLPLGYSFLFALGLVEIQKKLSRFTNSVFFGRFILILIVFLTMGVYVWPMWTGDVFGGIKNDVTVQVPRSYKDVNDWLRQEVGEFRVIQLPLGDGDGMTYKWENTYSGKELSIFLFDRPFISRLMFQPFVDNVLQPASDFLESPNLGGYLQLVNARYLLVNKDIDFVHRKLLDPEVIKEKLDKNPSVFFQKKFGNLFLYQTRRDNWGKQIYPSDKILVLEDVDEVLDGLKDGSFEPKEQVVVFKSGFPKEFKLGEGYLPEVEFQKVDPTKYEITVSGNTSSFVLVFNETYHPLWELSSNGKKFKHFLVNGFANGYYINETGDLNLKLEFSPQRFFKQGVIISVLSMIFLGGLVVCNAVSKRRVKKED